jgi:hypothetical protein
MYIHMYKILLAGLMIVTMTVLFLLTSKIIYLPFQHQAIAQINYNNKTTATMVSTMPSQSNKTIGNFTPYEDPNDGIKIQYPSDWTVSETGLRDHTNVVAFYSPLENPSDAISEHVLISLIHYSQNIALDDYGKLVNDTLTQPDIQTIESKAITLASGLPTHAIVFKPPSSAVGNSALVKPEIMLLWTVKGNNVYTISYNAEAAKYSKYLPIVEKMIDSFEITK